MIVSYAWGGDGEGGDEGNEGGEGITITNNMLLILS